MKSGKVYVSHDVTNFEFLYEPFYVAKDIVPAHDERFMGYGYTRNTQVWISLLFFEEKEKVEWVTIGEQVIILNARTYNDPFFSK